MNTQFLEHLAALANDSSFSGPGTKRPASKPLTRTTDVTAAIAHDLNNLLACIIGNVQLLEIDAADTAQCHVRIAAATERARLLVGRLQRPVAKDPSIVDTARTVRRLISVFPGVLPSRSVLEVSVEADSARVIGRESDLELVAVNLVTNAGNALRDPGARVNVTLRDGDADDIVLEVTNSGPVIQPTRLAQLFETGFTTKPGGSGIGLSLVKEAVKNLCGTIEVASNETETRFTVRMPRARAGRPEHLLRRAG